MVPGGKLLITIGYKYNAQTNISFVVIDNKRNKLAGHPYLFKYTDLFTNVPIRPVSCPLDMSKFFGVVIDFDAREIKEV